MDGQSWLDLFQQTFDMIDEGIFIVQKAGYKIVYANRKAIRIFDLKSKDYIGKNCHYILFNKLTACADCPIDSMYQTMTPQIRHIDYTDHRSFQRNLLCKYSPLDQNYFLLSVLDQTQEKSLISTITSQAKEMKAKNVVLKLRRQELEKKKTFLSSILNGVKDGIMVVDRSYNVEMHNQTLLDVTQMESGFDGVPCYRVYQRNSPCDDCPMFDSFSGKMVSARQVIDRESGDEKNLTVYFSTADNFLIETVRDTTREKRLLTMIKGQQEQLFIANRHLEDANNEITQMFTKLKETYEQLEVAQAHIDEEMRQVEELQQSLLPKALPSNSLYDIASFYTPADKVGGDYYDFIELSNGELGVLVADVSGHGLPAAVIMAMTRVVQRALSYGESSPAATLDKVNSMLCENIYTNDFVTMFYMILSADGAPARYSSAGHNPLLQYCASTGDIIRYTSKGFFLGAFDIGGYEEDTISFAPGDILLLYTDGLVEAMNIRKEQYGYDPVERILQENHGSSAAQIVEILRQSVMEFVDGVPLGDDMTLVVVKINET
ncbi:SpoIIE family protein phosphatase [Desulfurispirillum indicum]|uniref:SpoIIE family protein phosphatase n=1 Tax=Desulfurispirillum indicum TaxID=936456 RepID=UPI001CFA978B|nr:SpoIIE family protein phosphatase [Desulfurispirillum indicum]UCZ57396.1 SpoIIE family protein phosphatase [Desulfurispirillum indicum]